MRGRVGGSAFRIIVLALERCGLTKWMADSVACIAEFRRHAVTPTPPPPPPLHIPLQDDHAGIYRSIAFHPGKRSL